MFGFVGGKCYFCQQDKTNAMKLRLFIQIAVVVSVVLLCTGFGVYSFFRLNSVEHQREFNLYTLVPQDAIAVFETDRMADLVNDINELNCSKENHFLYASELFVYLKKYLHVLAKETPHGLSREMNKMLISFHEPDMPMNQVLYCGLGEGDHELLENFIRKYGTTNFPSKNFDYKGKEIRIYPMADGLFLAVYMTSDFLVASFQKRLVEQVIDAGRRKNSLMEMPSFCAIHAGKHSNMAAMVYVRMKSVDMGKATDDIRSQTRLGSWVEFDMKFNEGAIYCSGVSHGTDSTHTFINALRVQKPIEGFSGDNLPFSTFLYNHWAISDWETVLTFTASQKYAKATYSDYIRQRDEEVLAFLNDFAGESVMSCLFLPKDGVGGSPCAVMRIPMKDELAAERRLQSLLNATPKEEGEEVSRSVRDDARYPKARKYKKYVLPRNTLLAQLTGITESALNTYACFYQGGLLLAPDVQSLSAYIEALEEREVLGGVPVYEEVVGSLSPMYNFVMMMDMEEMLLQPEAYVRLVPNLFFRQAEFFRHFIVAVQFTCTEGVVYPNIVLLYKGSSADNANDTES